MRAQLHNHMRVLAFTNKKGGSCKTTSAVFLGEALARGGHRVLVMDLDAQAHATAALTGSYELPLRPMFPLHLQEAQLSQYIQPSNRRGIHLDVFPPDALMDAMDLRAYQLGFLQGYKYGRETGGTSPEALLHGQTLHWLTWLRRALQPLKDRYDFVLLDCPPVYNLATLNALLAAQEVLVPLDTRGWSYLAAKWVSQFRDQLMQTLNQPPPRILGYLLCRFRADWSYHQDIAAWLEKEYGSLLFETRIRDNKQCYEAAFYGRSPWESKLPRAQDVAADYENLAAEVLRRLS